MAVSILCYDREYDENAIDGWSLGELRDIYAIRMVIAFLAAGIYSEEFKWRTDAIFFTTKLGRSKGTRAKIATGLIMATLVYWVFMLVLSLLTFTVMGTSGTHSPIQADRNGHESI